MGSATSLPFYLMSWVVVGMGMGGGLYDADVFDPRALLRPPGARRHHGPHTLGRVCQHRLLAAQRYPGRGCRMAGNLFCSQALHLCFALPLQLVPRRRPPVEPEAPVEDAETPTKSVDLRDHV